LTHPLNVACAMACGYSK